MIKVITYGTYDLLHYGHINLLRRAKELGDYLIVGVTADDFDKTRGKINVQQSLMERVEAVRSLGIADEVIVEEYEGQKIDDIQRLGIDIFTVGSDWVGQFDYLSEYCRVVYLPRTEGVSSSEIREEKRAITLGLVGDSLFLNKVDAESAYVNGLKVTGVCTESAAALSDSIRQLPLITEDYTELLVSVDAVYIRSQPHLHYTHIKKALEQGKHVLCEAPMAISRSEWDELTELAKQKGLVLMDALKTAYSTAYSRLLLLLKGGKIGNIVSVDSTCTSLQALDPDDPCDVKRNWNNIYEWGPTALLPIVQLLGTEYRSNKIVAHFVDEGKHHDDFVKMDFVFPHAVASIRIGNGVKSEGELVVSGTKGYAYVPSPWWKTDYFELRYEDPSENKRYFYQLDGEGIRYELVAFVRAIETGRGNRYMSADVSRFIAGIMEQFGDRDNVITI